MSTQSGNRRLDKCEQIMINNYYFYRKSLRYD